MLHGFQLSYQGKRNLGYSSLLKFDAMFAVSGLFYVLILQEFLKLNLSCEIKLMNIWKFVLFVLNFFLFFFFFLF